jgi:putative endonuclease
LPAEVVPVRAKDAVGAYGERVAVRFLVDAGLVVLDRNWRCSLGEIDIVARDGDCLVVCEVKTRSSAAFGHPLEAVSRRKALRLRSLAMAWVADRGVHPPEIRIDLVAVLRSADGAAQVDHVRAVA